MDVLKPTLRVLAFSDTKGCEIGSAAGLVLYAPYALYKNQTPSIVGAACMSAIGSGVGASALILHSTYKMARAGGVEQIKTMASELQVSKVDKACGVSAVLGLAVGVNRLAWLAKNDSISLPSAVASKRGVWVLASFASLGVGICFASFIAYKGGDAAVSKIKAKIDSARSKSAAGASEEPRELDEETPLVDAANGTVDAAATAVTDSVDAATAE